MSYQNIVILTGAGISQESGLGTFRDNGGLWAEYAIEDVATPEAFAANPRLVYDFYNMRRAELLKDEISFNSAHQALADFESHFAGQFKLVTQNVDNLHEAAGSKSLIHMHGELQKARCLFCGHISMWEDDLDEKSICPSCQDTRGMRPHIVWFGEMPLQMDDIYSLLADCDLFVSIGTSGNVYPAAGFVQIANDAGAHTVELNLEPSQGATLFKEKIYGKASEIVPAFLKGLGR